MRRAGFSLLEMLIVIGIVAILAGGVILALGDVGDDASWKAGLAEIQEIKKAVLRFKADTGFLPRQGPFNLTTAGGQVPPPPQGSAWFWSPANLGQLIDNPLAGTGHPLEHWDRDAGRGWRGPYLSGFGEGLVDVGDSLQPNGAGSPVAGGLLLQMRGVADPFAAPPAGIYLGWRTSPGGPVHARHGRPYLLLGTDQPSLDQLKLRARIVGFGPNGLYESNDADTGGDDVVVFLFR